MSKARKELEKRATREMLIHSFFEWKSAVVLALVIILTAVTFGLLKLYGLIDQWAWLLAVWPIFGILSELALAWSNLNDPEFGRRVVAAMLEEEFSVRRITDRKLSNWIKVALDYRSRIESNIRETSDGILKDHLLDVADEIEQWIKNVYHIARRLDEYMSDSIIKRDRESVPKRIKNLELQLAQEKDAAIRAQLEATLRTQRTHQNHLDKLSNAMQRAELQLESTLSALGTVYSQTLLVEAKDIDSGRAKRLRQDISEQVVELEDLLTAMDEVYKESATSP
ncbi:MAG: hypothetical protein JXA42_01605 [Anaerolineales bacterium]|nr:hypothetical protein [Anaerolineales bacterium]